MVDRVLVIGGQGHIGRSVVQDLLTYTEAEVTITGRTIRTDSNSLPARVHFSLLDLADHHSLERAIAAHTLTIHCAGPFRQRDTFPLITCIEQGVAYVDVSDDRDFTKMALMQRAIAQARGVTAIINTGVFPGISNSLVRRAVEQLSIPEEIRLSYVVGGSGGAGITVMRTTFLNLQTPFSAWINKLWREVKPYSGREIVEFPAPFGRTGVYWFDLPEAYTLAENFPVHSVTVKFGTTPDLYNHLTWLTAHWMPPILLRQPAVIEALSQISYRMTAITNRFTSTGVAVRAEVIGQRLGRRVRLRSTLLHDSAATATGIGAASIAQLILSGALHKPGVWTVEQAVSTRLFEQTMRDRQIQITHEEG